MTSPNQDDPQGEIPWPDAPEDGFYNPDRTPVFKAKDNYIEQGGISMETGFSNPDGDKVPAPWMEKVLTVVVVILMFAALWVWGGTTG